MKPRLALPTFAAALAAATFAAVTLLAQTPPEATGTEPAAETPTAPEAPPADAPRSAAPDDFDEDAAVARLEKAIAGKEDRPAGEVFMWLETPLKEVPAGRFLRIMQFGFSRSLGVTCTHCHDTGNWDSDAKPQKQVARRMLALVDTINDRLAEIQGIDSPNPIVNCTTCHRGQVKPALRLGGEGPGAKPQ